MQQVITAKLKLLPTKEQHQQLRLTQLAYRDALNALSQYAFTHKKTSSVTTLHRGMYRELRTRYLLPSQMACSAEKQVAATYKGLWTKLKRMPNIAAPRSQRNALRDWTNHHTIPLPPLPMSTAMTSA